MLSMEDKINAIIKKDYRPVLFDIENAVNTLKELAEHGGCSIPKYDYGSPDQLGYDKDGNPIWDCVCTITTDNALIRQQVRSSSKKIAKKAAAYLVLCEHYELQNQYGVNGKYLSWKYINGKLMPYHMI